MLVWLNRQDFVQPKDRPRAVDQRNSPQAIARKRAARIAFLLFQFVCFSNQTALIFDQVVKSQLNLWQEEVRKAQQSKSPVSKKRVLEFSDSDGKQSPDYSKKDSDGSDEELARDEDRSSRFGFNEKDIVWVELEEQEVKWPALVQKIYPASGQVSVQLIDIPIEDRPYASRTLYPIKEVITFDQADQNIRFLDETKSKYVDSIVNVVQRAEDYSRKKLLGEHLDIDKLFGSGSRLSAAAAAIGDQKQPQSSKSIKINNDSLLRYIKSGKIDSYLLSVYNESIGSERHANFKADLKASAGSTNYGPFDYEEDREDLFNYLKELFKGNFKVDNNFDVVVYLLDVWIPEVSSVSLSWQGSGQTYSAA